MQRRGMGKARGGKRYAEGGAVTAPVTVAERIRRFVGMPTGQRGKQLERQEREALGEEKK